MMMIKLQLVILPTFFYLSGCKKSKQTVNQTGGVVRLLGNKQNNRLNGAGRTGNWMVANYPTLLPNCYQLRKYVLKLSLSWRPKEWRLPGIC